MDDEGLGGRLPLLPPNRLEPNALALYDRLINGRLGEASPFRSRTADGALIGPFNALLHAPATGVGFIDLHEAEERGTPLSARLRETIILSVGAVWECAYELYAHRAVAARVGFAPEVVAALATGDAHPALSKEERSAQRFTLELARDRGVTDISYTTCENILGRDRLVAVVLLTAAYMGTCVILNAFAVPEPIERGTRLPLQG